MPHEQVSKSQTKPVWRWMETTDPVPTDRASFDEMFVKARPMTPVKGAESIVVFAQYHPLAAARKAVIARDGRDATDVFDIFAEAVIEKGRMSTDQNMRGIFLCRHDPKNPSAGTNRLRAAFNADVKPIKIEFGASGPTLLFKYKRADSSGFIAFGSG